MKLKRIFAVLMLASAMLLPSFLQHVYAKGPRTDDLLIDFYALTESCYSALQIGQIDIMAWPLNALQYINAISDPNIVLAPCSGDDMYGFPFNLNETIKTYSNMVPKLVSPMTYLGFRQAIAHLVDKDWAVDVVCGGFAKRIDVPVPYAQSSYWNTSVIGANYPYQYHPAIAAQLLDGAGFLQGPTPNAYYSPNFPGSAQYIRTYPADHNYSNQDLHPIVFCARTDQYLMYQVAVHFRDNIRKMGIPVDWVEGDANELYGKVIENGDYHIYTGGQFAWRFPVALTQLGFQVMLEFIAPQPMEQGPLSDLLGMWRDWLTGLQEEKIGQYLNESRKSWISPTFTESLAHSKQAQGRYVESVFGIPLWSTYSYYAYRKGLLGVVNVQGYGIVNQYTFMNAYREGGGPIRIGLTSAPVQMNIMHSHWYSDYQVLDTLYNDLTSFAPYSITSDQPWIVQDWTTGTWNNPESGKDCTVVDFWFRKDVYAAEPVTGNQGPQLTAYDYEFSSHYIYAQGYEGYLQTPHWGRFKDIYNVTVVDPYHVKVFMNVTSYWAPNAPTYPIVPKNVWLREPLAHHRNAYFQTGVNITLPGNVPLAKRVMSGSADTSIQVQLSDGSYRTLVWGRDYTWTRGILSIKVASIGGVQISEVWVYYWIYGETGGYFPADSYLDWRETLVGFGPYYVNTLNEGVGGFIGLKRNPFFFMETPVLGEVDWVWKWGTGARPRSGYYKIDIYDLTYVSGAYGSQGTAVPDARWFPGADLASQSGLIDIYDQVTVTSNWDKKFGQPP